MVVLAKSRAPSDTSNLTKAIMLSTPDRPQARAQTAGARSRVFPSDGGNTMMLQAQLSRARCEVETLKTLKTDSVSKDLQIRDLQRKLKHAELDIAKLASEAANLDAAASVRSNVSFSIDKGAPPRSGNGGRRGEHTGGFGSFDKYPLGSPTLSPLGGKGGQHAAGGRASDGASLGSHSVGGDGGSVPGRESGEDATAMDAEALRGAVALLQESEIAAADEIAALQGEVERLKKREVGLTLDMEGALGSCEAAQMQVKAMAGRVSAGDLAMQSNGALAEALEEAKADAARWEQEATKAQEDASDANQRLKDVLSDSVTPLAVVADSPSSSSSSQPSASFDHQQHSPNHKQQQQQAQPSHIATSSPGGSSSGNDGAGAGAGASSGASGSGGSGMSGMWGRMKTPRSALSTPRAHDAAQALKEAQTKADVKETEIERLREVVAVGQKEISRLQTLVSSSSKPHSAHAHTSGAQPRRRSLSNDSTESAGSHGSTGKVPKNGNKHPRKSTATNNHHTSGGGSGHDSKPKTKPLNEANDESQEGGGALSPLSIVLSAASPPSPSGKSIEGGGGGGGGGGCGGGQSSSSGAPVNASGNASPQSSATAKASPTGQLPKRPPSLPKLELVEFLDDLTEHEEELAEKYGVALDEFKVVRNEYETHVVTGLNKKEFMVCMVRLLNKLEEKEGATGKNSKTAAAAAAAAKAVPKKSDLLKAFEMSDKDGSGVVDLDEFVGLYSKVKKGEVKGLGSFWGKFFGSKAKKVQEIETLGSVKKK